MRAVASHADFLGVPRETPMEKTLFAVDELSGFIMACAYVRPQGIHGLTPKSVKKKMKTPAFAAAIDRDAMRAGAEALGVDFDEHLDDRDRRARGPLRRARARRRRSRVILYEHPSSGNCLKARVMLDQVGASYERVVLDLFAGETRTPEHFARNPDGRIPVLELDSGEFIAESGAILLYLAEGSEYLPADPLLRAQIHAWMFFEQNQVEANLGVARFLALSGRAEGVPEVFADRQRRGRDALATLERGLGDDDFVVGNAYSVADLALTATCTSPTTRASPWPSIPACRRGSRGWRRYPASRSRSPRCRRTPATARSTVEVASRPGALRRSVAAEPAAAAAAPARRAGYAIVGGLGDRGAVTRRELGAG